ncbi:MAG: hypothetical protein IJU23_11835 [Proteobacteria bacterium]|nr:hypothetical protein [Pseudomonadota bacterium]
MTSTEASGHNKYAFLLSLIMAFILIGLMVYMGRNSTPYSIPVSSFQPNGDIFCRLDGTVTMKDGNLSLCESGKCVRIEAPKGEFLEPGRRVMAEGQYRDGILIASRILTRCDHGRGESE